VRLWDKDLIDVLPDNQLRGQWRECCLIAKGLHYGTLNHLLVNKVKDYPIEHFIAYTFLVLEEMKKRGYKCDGKRFTHWLDEWESFTIDLSDIFDGWHNERYLRQCLYNLQEKYDCSGISDGEWKLIVEKFPWIKECGLND